MDKMREKNIIKSKLGKIIIKSEPFNQIAIDLIIKMIDLDPLIRFHCHQCLKHSFFTTIPHDIIISKNKM